MCFSIQLKFLYSVCSPYKQIVVLHDIVLYIKTSLICVCVCVFPESSEVLLSGANL